MSLEELIRKCLVAFREQQRKKRVYQNYYEGEHDITKNYALNESRSNMVVVVNFFKKFVQDEVAYALGNSIAYTSTEDKDEALSSIEDNFSHWERLHNQRLALEGIKFGESYELKYIDENKDFKCTVLTPLEMFVVESGNVEKKIDLGLHVYKPDMFSNEEHADVYHGNKVYTYKLSAGDDLTLLSEKTINFKSPPIRKFKANFEASSLLDDIKAQNDAYNNVLSDLINEVSDFRQALLKVVGAQEMQEEQVKKMKKNGIIYIPTGADVGYLIKELNDTFVQNLLNTIEDKLYKQASHIDTNEKLQSNLSASALRSRMISLENKCIMLQSMMEEIIKARLKDYFEFVKKRTKVLYDFKKIKVKQTMNIPADIQMLADSFSKLKDHISQETILGQIPFVDNPKIELEKWLAEQQRKKELGL